MLLCFFVHVLRYAFRLQHDLLLLLVLLHTHLPTQPSPPPLLLTSPCSRSQCYRIHPDHRAQLGAFLRSLPHLQALTIEESYSRGDHSALISALSAPVAEDFRGLQELHCSDFSAASIEAVSNLFSLKALSWECMRDPDTPHSLRPLSSLSLLTRLSIDLGSERGNYASLLAVRLPQSLRILSLHAIDAEQLCKFLRAAEQGTGLPSSLKQLHVCDLDLQHNNSPPDWQWHELGLMCAAHLAAFPTLLVTIDGASCAPKLSRFFAFFEPIAKIAQGFTNHLVFMNDYKEPLGAIAATDMACLVKLCPQITSE